MITPEQEAAAELKRVIDFLEVLGDKEEDDLCTLMHSNGKEYARLLVAIGSLTTKACGNLNKIYELVTTLEICAEKDTIKYEVRHVKHEYCADIVITNRETLEKESIESKHSMTIKGDRYRTDWSFVVNASDQHAYKREPTSERLCVLIDSIYSKQSNGLTYLTVRTGKELLHRYEVNGYFIALYCAKKLTTASCNSVNLGCQRCEVCGHYHRVLSLQAWGKELASRILAQGKAFQYTFAYFTPVEWQAIFKLVPSRCVVRKNNTTQWVPSVTHWEGSDFP